MNDREAKALGRFCDKHNRKFERVHRDGYAVTGCAECVTKNAEAFNALAAAARTMGARYTGEGQ